MSLKNNLYTEYPKIASEWDDLKNGNATPKDFAPHSNKKVWWNCPEGHSYKMTIDHRTGRGSGCPYCSGKKVLLGYNDLKTVNPELASEWNRERNAGLRSEDVVLHSNKIVWWKCSECGNEWRAKVNDRSNGQGCPVCAKKKRILSFRKNYVKVGQNDLATLRPDLLMEWDHEKNIGKKPENYTCNSSEKVYWRCSICGNEWVAQIKNRVNRNSGCPRCMKYKRTSFPEQALFYYIKKIYPNTENGYTDLIVGSTIELDIFIPEESTGIEYDGKAWHTNTHAVKTAKKKYAACQEKKIKLIRIGESEAVNDSNCDIFVLRKDLSSKGLNTIIQKVLKLITKERISVDCERDRSDIMQQYITIIRDKSIAVRAPELVKEWDFDRNHPITPEMVNATTPKKYWWLCSRKHSYRAVVANKYVGHSGCPICSGRECLPGFNDLKTRYPEIAREWDEMKNAPLSASEVMPGSTRRYWWICDKGHSYQASPNTRTSNGSGCPVCGRKTIVVGINDFASEFPMVAKKWNYKKNKGLTPQEVFSGSPKQVWWCCEKGHEWKKSIYSQIKSNNCPVCNVRQLEVGYNDLKTTHPHVSKEWNHEKNNGLRPQDVMQTYQGKVWWKCSVCGKEWCATVRSRTKANSGCPSCGYKNKMQETRAQNIHNNKKDLVNRFPEIAKEWDYEKNDIDPSYVSPGSNRKVWWICPKGHSYQAWMSDRTGKWKTGCPYCAGKRKI